MKISTKREWYKIQRSGIFNITKAYTPEEFLRIHKQYARKKMFCFRTMGEGGGKFVCMTAGQAVKEIRQGLWTNSLLSEQAPDDAIVVQGEYDGVQARITFEKTPMRFAFAVSSQEVTRGELIGIIGWDLYRQLDGILEDFNPSTNMDLNPVIEFSVYSKVVGTYAERMIVWEVRNY